MRELAHRISEVDLQEYVGYWQLQSDLEEKARKEAEAKSKSNRPRGRGK